MRIEPLSFKEFGADTPARIAASGLAPLLPGGRRREGVPPPPPSFSEEQMKAAEREAYKKGFIDGTQEGKNQAESEQALADRQLSGMAEKFADALTPLLAAHRRAVLQLKQDMPKVALCIARKVAGDALAANAQAAVEEAAQRCVEIMAAEPKIAVTVHESLAPALEKKLKELAARLQSAADIVVVSDSGIDKADCRIEWKHGAMERHTGQLWERVEEAVGRMSAGAAHAAEEHMDSILRTAPAAAQDPVNTATSQPDPAQSLRDSQDKPKE